MMKTIEQVREVCPHLHISEGAEEVLVDFFEKIEESKHPQIEEILDVLEEKLKYLDQYGGVVSDDDPRRRYKVSLYRDPLAVYCFNVRWQRLDQVTGKYQSALSGGLQCNAVQHAFPSVQIGDPQWWSIHT